jgi:uncharacterized protein (TIGR00369 family)
VTTRMDKAGIGEIRRREHRDCVVCSPTNERGLGLEFIVWEDGSVEATFNCKKEFEGYRGLLHGGVISALLDGAMTNCMFAHGYTALTAELNVRFHQPVTIGVPVKVRAWMKKDLYPLFIVEAEVLQNQEIKASAAGKFMKSAS